MDTSAKPNVGEISSWFDQTYYRNYGGGIPYERSEYWLRFFHTIADRIVRALGPRRVLDAGCAQGFLVEALWERGVQTYGIDLSQYAIGEVRRDMQPYCRRGSLTDPLEGRYDLVTCFEVLEHIPDGAVQDAVRNLTAVTDAILFSTAPHELGDPTRINVQPTIHWLHLFAEHGFAPDLLFDAGFVAPHAFLLRRTDELPADDVLVLFSEMIRYRRTLADVATLAARVPQQEAAKAQREIIGAIAALTEYADSLQMKSEQLGLRLAAAETRLAEVGHQTLQILQSRIWRTLCIGGAMVLSPRSFFRSLRGAGSPPPVLNAPPAGSGKDFPGLVCDEPRPSDDYPRTGKISVNGWVLAGGDRVEVSLPGVTAAARMRPGVASVSPDAAGSRTCEFTAEIDTSAVPNGLHILRAKAFTRGSAVHEAAVPVRIDHQSGYASDYDRWIAEFENRSEPLIQLKLRVFSVKPLVSILVPVYRTPTEVLRRTIESVLAQSYSNWQLCIADDGSQSPEIERLLGEYAARDERIQVKFLPANRGISQASNAALELAKGELVALLDHDDELAQDALYYMVEALNRCPDADLLYSDEDKIDSRGRRYDPFFKPDWSPDLLLSENYICHLLVVRRSLLNQAGGFRSDFDGSQDYDLVLRLTAVTKNILHVPRVLYHWRSLPSSTASVSSQKPYAVDAAQRALQQEMDRRGGSTAKVVPGSIPGRWRVRYLLAGEWPVSIVIASGGNVEVLRNNLQALFAKTEYDNYEVVVIDNSKSTEIEKLVQKWPDPRRPLRYLDWRNKPFNYSQINNEAARHCQAPLLLFLNDDTTVIAPGWLEAMVELAARPEVGAVGARLLYPGGRIQHAGVVMGLFDNCGHAFKGLPGDRQHYFDLPDVIRNVSAVTGACLMVRAAVFAEVGGFDEQAFAVAFNDIDLCLKIGQKDYRVLYTPHALLYHHEAFSKTAEDLVPHPDEVRAMQSKWKAVIAADPFYSPNLTRTAENYSLRRKA